MKTRFNTLPKLWNQLACSRWYRRGLRAVGTCLVGVSLTSVAQAQVPGGFVYPAANTFASSGVTAPNQLAAGQVAVGQVIPSQAIGQVSAAGVPITEPINTGVYIGPGGNGSALDVPSVLGPSPTTPTRLVNQPYSSGPFMQQPPVVAEQPVDLGIPCPGGCDLRGYGWAEALYFRREYDQNYTMSQTRLIEPFNYEWAGRVTVGRLSDCVNGYEFSYAGPFKWERELVTTGAGQQSKLTPIGLDPSLINTFNNADYHSQIYTARMNSYEFNRRWWAWDIFSMLAGIRVVDYRENFGFYSNNPTAGSGMYLDQARNLLLGAQIGGEHWQPLGLRTLIGLRGKAALLANFNRNQVYLENNGLAVLNAYDNDVDVSGLFELGAFAKYSITRSIRVSAGYELWYLPGMATVPEQNLFNVTTSTGAKSQTGDDVLLQGASFGAEILF